MSSETQRVAPILQIICAVATSFAAALSLLVFVVLCVEGVRHHGFGDHELGMPIGLGIVALISFFSAHIASKLWRGSLSSNGITLMPTWFIRTFGVFFLAG